MQITRKSNLTGVVRTFDLAVTEAQLLAYAQGDLLQEAFANLTADEREFIKSGITQEEWDEVFA